MVYIIITLLQEERKKVRVHKKKNRDLIQMKQIKYYKFIPDTTTHLTFSHDNFSKFFVFYI